MTDLPAHLTNPTFLLVITLAAARVTHLITVDTPFQPLRGRLESRPLLDELVNCAWCIGFWVSVLAVASMFLPPAVVFLLALPWAISYLIGILETYANRPHSINGD